VQGGVDGSRTTGWGSGGDAGSSSRLCALTAKLGRQKARTWLAVRVRSALPTPLHAPNHKCSARLGPHADTKRAREEAVERAKQIKRGERKGWGEGRGGPQSVKANSGITAAQRYGQHLASFPFSIKVRPGLHKGVQKV